MLLYDNIFSVQCKSNGSGIYFLITFLFLVLQSHGCLNNSHMSIIFLLKRVLLIYIILKYKTLKKNYFSFLKTEGPEKNNLNSSLFLFMHFDEMQLLTCKKLDGAAKVLYSLIFKKLKIYKCLLSIGLYVLVWGCFTASGPGQLVIIIENINSQVLWRMLSHLSGN